MYIDRFLQAVYRFGLKHNIKFILTKWIFVEAGERRINGCIKNNARLLERKKLLWNLKDLAIGNKS